jgi:hypothetical protein
MLKIRGGPIVTAKVYVMRDASGELKIGFARDPHDRMKRIERPKIELLFMTDDMTRADTIERLAHKLMRVIHGPTGGGEWYPTTLDVAVSAIRVAKHFVEGGDWSTVEVVGAVRTAKG